jgi:metallo-beta-lactamase family protein
MESTYGDRERNAVDNVASELARIMATASHLGGPVIIPTFAIGRAQQLLHELKSLERRGLLNMNVYLDAPLAARATSVYAQWPSYLHTDARDTVDDPLDFESLYSLMSRKSAGRLDDLASPAVIMAGNGFGEGGPILRHLARWLPDPNATILLTGHCLAGTLVAHLATDPPTIKIDGRPVPVEARIELLDAFGGHADASGLERWLLTNGMPGKVVLNHGETAAREALAERLTNRGCHVQCPSIGETIVV